MTAKTVHEPVIVERDGATVQLVLNRPEAGNALDVPMARALLRAAIECDEDESVRCVVITGSGSMFCAGGDISGFTSAGGAVGVHIKEITSYFHAAVTRLMRMAKPVVTAVNGPAAGAGMSLAIAGDIVLATTSAHFTVAYGKLGYTPDGGMTWTLPRLVGLRRAQDLLITNRRVSAGEALALGLVTRLVEGDAFAQTVAGVAADLAISATGAIGRTRALLQSSFGSTLETQLEYEAQAIAASARTPHGREGVAAFTSKRKPDFSGSGIENV
jgi:2-(1,2-epoxy-1,2-dihydrophenyl)acetyl-CoA isomerase